MYSGARSMRPSGVHTISSARGTIGSQVDAVRLGLDLLERETVGDLAVAVAPRAGAHLQVDDPLGASTVVLREDVGARRASAIGRAR